MNLPYTYSTLYGEWHIPRLTGIHDIFYTPGINFGTALGFDHLMISANDEIWGINTSFLTEGSGIWTQYFYSNFRITLDGTASAIWGDGHNVLYGGNFTLIYIQGFDIHGYPWSLPQDWQDLSQNVSECQGAYEADKLVSLSREVFLPIELAEFTVKSDDNKIAQLAWTSLTENNSAHYEIERRTDNEDFAYVGTVEAAGESLEEINYTYEDDISKVSGNYVYYRLKMVDKDGSYEYSDVRSLKLEMRDSGISIAPNPAVNNVELSMKMDTGGDVNVHIYDMQGRQLCNYQWTYNDNSIVRERINVSHLEAGLYLVEVVSPHERKTMKLDVLR